MFEMARRRDICNMLFVRTTVLDVFAVLYWWTVPICNWFYTESLSFDAMQAFPFTCGQLLGYCVVRWLVTNGCDIDWNIWCECGGSNYSALCSGNRITQVHRGLYTANIIMFIQSTGLDGCSSSMCEYFYNIDNKLHVILLFSCSPS